MIVMPSNNSGKDAWNLFKEYPGRMAHLQNADSLREPKFGHRWALDNGVYGAFASGRIWDESPLYAWLDKHSDKSPEWVVVPDSIGNKHETIKQWKNHAPRIAAYGVKLAMAVQDGMTPEDVPPDAEVVFVGGSTQWKWRNLRQWTAAFPRVHVGRVNTYRLLWMAHEAGAESCDGTGWFRGDQSQLNGLRRYLDESEPNEPHPDPCLL